MSKWIIFTDLDGTLLGHDDYAYEPILPLLEQLKQAQIPVVLNSSKTLAELKQWQQRLKLEGPVIGENGGVILPPETSQPLLIGEPYTAIRSLLEFWRSKHGWQFEGFGDWSVSELMNHTHLSEGEAVLSMERAVSEPILWQDSPAALETFEAALSREGLQLQKGGRFYHVMGRHDKADAMHFWLNRAYYSNGQSCQVIALGDGENDLSMLRYADYPVVVINPSRATPLADIEKAMITTQPAPQGWVEGVNTVMANFKGEGYE